MGRQGAKNGDKAVERRRNAIKPATRKSRVVWTKRPKELWLLGKMTNARDDRWRAAKTKAVCFEDGFHARGYIVKTNDYWLEGVKYRTHRRSLRSWNSK